MSDTPLTDTCPTCGYPHHDMTLTRELAAAQARIAELRAHIDRLDCTYREGTDAVWCRPGALCVMCQRNTLMRERDNAVIIAQRAEHRANQAESEKRMLVAIKDNDEILREQRDGFANQLRAMRERSARQRRELRRLNAQIKYLWCAWRAGLLASDVMRLRGAMQRAFGVEAVRAAERAAVDAEREAK